MKIGEFKELTFEQDDMISLMILWLERLDKKQDNIIVTFTDDSGIPDSFVKRPSVISPPDGIDLNIGMLLSKLERVRKLGRYEYDELAILNLLREFFYKDFEKLYK
jgi:hypothetical protein